MTGNGRRGQTTQDYLTGVSIMLLVLAGVFTFVPGIFVTVDDSIESAQYAHADQLADEILLNASAPGQQSTLERAELLGSGSVFINGPRYHALEKRAGINSSGTQRGIQSNVTLLAPPDYTVYQTGLVGDTYYQDQHAAALRVRLITFSQNSTCDPSCRLVVRVWKET